MFVKIIVRLLCGLVDWIIVTVVCQIVLFGILNVEMGLTPLIYFMIVYCVYNGLFVKYMHGQTPGKALGRLVVINTENPPNERQQIALFNLFLRESCKALYFFPIAGWLAGLVSVVLILVQRTPFHDSIGRTMVVFVGKNDRQPPSQAEL